MALSDAHLTHPRRSDRRQGRREGERGGGREAVSGNAAIRFSREPSVPSVKPGDLSIIISASWIALNQTHGLIEVHSAEKG